MLSNPVLDTLCDQLTDQALLDQFGDLVRQHHHHTAALLRHLDVIDKRKLSAKYGHSSTLAFCVSRYHMSESTAFKRIGAARTARRFPILFEMVAKGEIHLSGIHRLTAHLTPENHVEVLAQAKHKTVRQIELLVAQLAPRPDVPTTLRALPQRREPAVAAPLVPATSPNSLASAPLTPPPTTSTAPVEPPKPPAPLAPPAPRRVPDPEPLSPGRFKLQLTIDETTRQKLKQLQDLLAHQIPNGDLAQIVVRALDVLLAQVHKRRTGITEKPRACKPSARKLSARKLSARKLSATGRARWIPAAIRREVWTRDQGCCSFVGEDSHRCGETRGLEFAHVKPWAKGGEHSASNLALRCPAHNAWEAERDYGASFMANKRAKPWQVREAVASDWQRGARELSDAAGRPRGRRCCARRRQTWMKHEDSS